MKSYTSASPHSLAAVIEWLAEYGITDVQLESIVHDYLTFSAPVHTANNLFDTDFHSFVHIPSGKRAIRTLQYSIPRDLASHINVIHPTTSFDLAKPLSISVSYGKRSSESSILNSSCADTITPQCLQDLYDIPATPATQLSNRIAVPGMIEYWAQVSEPTFIPRLNLKWYFCSMLTLRLSSKDLGPTCHRIQRSQWKL